MSSVCFNPSTSPQPRCPSTSRHAVFDRGRGRVYVSVCSVALDTATGLYNFIKKPVISPKFENNIIFTSCHHKRTALYIY